MIQNHGKPGFFDEQKSWSEIKLRVLEKYVESYMRIRGSSNATIFYVDGFAGPGYYGDGKEGSPVRIARVAQRIVDSGKGFRLLCIFTEAIKQRCLNLQAALRSFDPSLIQVRCDSFPENLPSIIQTLQRTPAIVFLDPFGVKEIPLVRLDPLLKRADTELLINFNTRRLWQLAGFEDSTAIEAPAKQRLVSSVLGDDQDSPQWMEEWRRLGKDARRWEHWALDRYKQRLLDRSPHLNYALSYPVRESLGSLPKYYLIFATRSLKAIEVMNDLLCTEEDDIFTKSRSLGTAQQIDFFVAARDSMREQQLAVLVDEMHSYGLAN